MSTHTPGPWVACGYENLTVNDSEGNTIVATPGSSTGTRIEMKANAALIAAAPAMLEALKLCVEALEFIPCRARNEAQEAIRLAEGRP